MRRVLTALVAIVMAASMVGCAQNEPQTAPQTRPEEQTAPQTQPEEQTEGTQTQPEGSSTEGAALVQEKCTQCHDLSRVEQAQKDAAGWAETVDRMEKNGLQVTAEEKQTIVDYLSTR